MYIWFNKSLAVPGLIPLGQGTMAAYLGMEWVAIGDDYMKMKMPVDHRTIQPYGLLHGVPVVHWPKPLVVLHLIM